MSTKKIAVVKRKLPTVEEKICEIIGRGGKTTEESKKEKEIRFTIRIPRSLVDKLDQDRKSRSGHVSRNQWIIESVDSHLESPNHSKTI